MSEHTVWLRCEVDTSYEAHEAEEVVLDALDDSPMEVYVETARVADIAALVQRACFLLEARLTADERRSVAAAFRDAAVSVGVVDDPTAKERHGD